MIKVAISTLGCKVNQYESAGILEELDRSDYSVVPFNEKADCYIINTCTVTGRTDYQSRQLIRRAIRTNPNAFIIVTGCYAQVAHEEIARIPGVTVIAGNAEKEHIPRIIEHLVRGEPPLAVSDISNAGKFSLLNPLKFRGHTRAFLKIQDGCNSFCSYCIVPYARGRSKSLPEIEVINRIETLAHLNYREIVLTGIHLGVYGDDLIPPSNLFNILAYVEKKKIVERLRLSSLEITEVTDEILQLIKEGATICRHLHIPLQSGDDGILSAMGRNYDSKFFKNILKKVWLALPDAAVGVDVMVGFPGEGEEEFKNTFRLIEELPLAYLHVFPYSERPGTPASELPGKIDEAIKKKRGKILRDIGRRKRNTFAEMFIGAKLTVLIEDKKEKDTGFMQGFSSNYIPVFVINGDSSLANRIVSVIPDCCRDGKLYGRTVKND